VGQCCGPNGVAHDMLSWVWLAEWWWRPYDKAWAKEMCGALESFKTDQLSVQLTFLHICTLLTGLLQRFMTGTADVQMKQLQSVQSMAAGLVSGAWQCEHIMPILHTHHYQRNSELRRCTSIFTRAVHSGGRYLRSSKASLHRLDVSSYHDCKQQSEAELCFSVLSVWNSLPLAIHDYSLSLNTFKQKMKTHMFGQWQTPSSRHWMVFVIVRTYELQCCVSVISGAILQVSWLTYYIIHCL